MTLASEASDAPQTSVKDKPRFQWDDPLLLDDALSEDERMVRDTVHDYAQEKLFPRVQEAFRNETFDREIMNECGELGLLGVMVDPEYGGAGLGRRNLRKQSCDARNNRFGNRLFGRQQGRNLCA